MENAANRANANEAREADEVGAVAEPEQHRDDENEDGDEDDFDEDMDDSDSDDSDSDDDDDDDSFIEDEVPTPEEVELEYTFPQDFLGRSWQDVVAPGQYFRLILDPSCTGIPTAKFQECKYLIEIVYPEGKDSKLLRIGHYAFRDCYNLQRMNSFPDGLVELGYLAFISCGNLQGRITIPASIRYVRESCFASCHSITSVVFESSTAITTVVVELEAKIFWSCKELLSVRLPNNLTVIPICLFMGCCSLIDVPIPRTVRTIQFSAFENCGSLSAVDLPESVIAINEEAYCDCFLLASVTIRSSTNALQVERNVFLGCASLATIRVVNPLVWSRLFSAMNFDPSFIYKFVRKYEGQIMAHHRSSR